MGGCVLSQLKPSELCILSCEKAAILFTAKNVAKKILGLYPIHGLLLGKRNVHEDIWFILSVIEAFLRISIVTSFFYDV